MTLSFAHIESLFHQYRDELMRRLTTMVHSRDAAADLVQETYLRLVRLADTQSVEQPRALLHRIATNLAIDHIRANRSGLTAPEPLEAALEYPCPLPSQERVLIGKERLREFIGVIEGLPPRTKEAFLLYRVYGYSYREIAQRMEISLSGVDKHIRRAIEQTCASLDSPDNEDE
ncbi:DNA-directed RNA polymerase sigma-70 factor [Nitrospira sp. KM1]|uniref:RNA polymerase sigma factor n=1 Tax=Nitrospira sp. KM1 TaxID=1936990 RepID=UPI0013A748A1|nr:RNA polymerase sigma factor [Nitrospira sp. KM1]BCA56588.1 DNA-directed RNA polymerase sigma-70 factor [Nitrospira sp. KM1]